MDDRLANVRHGVELVQRPHQIFLAAIREPPAGKVHVGRLQTLPQRLYAEAQLRQPMLIDVYRNLVLVAAAHQHRSHAKHGIEALFHHVFGVAAQRLQGRRVFPAGSLHSSDWLALQHDGGAHDGVQIRVQPQDGRPLDVQRQLRQIQLLAHFHGGVVHIRAPGELEHQIGTFRGRNGVHPPQAVDHAHALFQPPRDLLLHLRRRRALEIRAHRERGIRQLRQQIQPEAIQRQGAKQRHRQGGHRHRDAPSNGSGDDAHGLRSCSLEPRRHCRRWRGDAPAGRQDPRAATMRTGAPSRRPSWPRLTTASPASTPSTISMLPSET